MDICSTWCDASICQVEFFFFMQEIFRAIWQQIVSPVDHMKSLTVQPAYNEIGDIFILCPLYPSVQLFHIESYQSSPLTPNKEKTQAEPKSKCCQNCPQIDCNLQPECLVMLMYTNWQIRQCLWGHQDLRQGIFWGTYKFKTQNRGSVKDGRAMIKSRFVSPFSL